MAAPMGMVGAGGEEDVGGSTDNFRAQFKRYKRRKPPPDLGEVIDFQNSELVTQFYPQVPCQTCAMKSCLKLGLKPFDQWRCFTLQAAPGFVYISNPFYPGYQRYWIKRCLQDYPRKPNVCNLDGHHANRGDISLPDADPIEASTTKSKSSLIDQLRWVTLGYHYDWTSKLYHQNHCTPFPGDLADLSAFVAAMLGFPSFNSQAAIVSYYHCNSTLGGHTDHSEFHLTAPIISYRDPQKSKKCYKWIRNIMGCESGRSSACHAPTHTYALSFVHGTGHQGRGQQCFTDDDVTARKGLGQSAIFLLGGRTKETSPLAMYLHSGDVIVMGGQSRLAYHAVPRILMPAGSTKLPACLAKVSASDLGKSRKTWHEREDDKADLPSSSCSTTPTLDRKISLESDADTKLTNSGAGTTECQMHDKECQMHATTAPNVQESDSRLDTRCETVKSAGPSVKSDQCTQVECRLRCVSQKLSNSDCALIDETVLSLQEDQTWKPFARFMSTARINISVRQVTGPGCGFPSETTIIDHEMFRNPKPVCSDFKGPKRKSEYLDQ